MGFRSWRNGNPDTPSYGAHLVPLLSISDFRNEACVAHQCLEGGYGVGIDERKIVAMIIHPHSPTPVSRLDLIQSSSTHPF
jgi:hypothetical protein